METSQDEFMDRITRTAINNPRYGREAYLFVLKGMEWSMDQLAQRRHLSGEEFAELLAAFARHEYGDMAQFVLNEWGIYSTRDFGEIVYKLIEMDLMSRQQGDSIEDFDQVFELESVLNDPDFTPAALRNRNT
ncbi:MAG: Minf_1886 family protein [bacterium]